MEKTNIVKKVCRKCGQVYEDEMFELSKQGRREAKVMGKIMNGFLPKKFKEEMEAYIRKLAELTQDLCPDCMEGATKSLVPPSLPIDINKYR